MIVGQEVTAEMKLQGLYYGNVIQCQHDVIKNSDYAKRSENTKKKPEFDLLHDNSP